MNGNPVFCLVSANTQIIQYQGPFCHCILHSIFHSINIIIIDSAIRIRVAYGMKFQFKRCAFEHDFFLDHSFALPDAGMKGMEEKRKLRKCQLRGIIVLCAERHI